MKLKLHLIFDDKFLNGYIASEHFSFCLELEKLGWELIELSNLEKIKEILQSEGITLFVTYTKFDIGTLEVAEKCKVIYKLDDCHFPNENAERLAAKAWRIISPYAYLFNHPKVIWVPYTCVDEYVANLTFNLSPINKLLVSGSTDPNFYPFRHYVSTLFDTRIVQLPHPGYNQKYSKYDKGVGFDYHNELNKYLCCFVDASIFNYLMLKNFEIAGSGSLLLSDSALQEQLGQLGFIDQETCMLYNKDNFHEKLDYILDPANFLHINKIRRQGMQLVRTNHLTSQRARQLHDALLKELGG